MLGSVGELRTYMIAATDGEIGTVDDMDVDNESWVIRYLVVDTERWAARAEGPHRFCSGRRCRLGVAPTPRCSRTRAE
jgi:hypothetical protein